MDAKCGKCDNKSPVDLGTNFCRYCGSRYSDSGVSISKLLDLEEKRCKLEGRFIKIWILGFYAFVSSSLCGLLLISGLIATKWVVPIIFAWFSIFVIYALATQSIHAKRLKIKFPELYQ